MRNISFFIHALVIILIQIIILDNLNIHSYAYVNIYPLIIYILPNKINNTISLLLSFLIGLTIDISNNTLGIHIAASCAICYIRPRLLSLTSKREQFSDMIGKQFYNDFSWFFKYILYSTLIFNIIFITLEAFSFQNIIITFIRILFSTSISILAIIIYYLSFLKHNR